MQIVVLPRPNVPRRLSLPMRAAWQSVGRPILGTAAGPSVIETQQP